MSISNVKNVNIEHELKQSYLDYAMSVIVGRALPDVRDGLKPVHRRVLYAMSQLNNDWNKPYKKSARVVGDVIGKFHPHGETSVYDAIVRLAQDFSIRYPLIDGQGNFGSIDGDSAAAMRYTEVRMAKITHELLNDLEKETVDFVPNYDESEFCPSVLPASIPNLLVNGSSGIAVGMATNIPPHNLGEVIDGCLACIENPNISLEELIDYVPGPDFPTSGTIHGKAGIISAYKTGKGKIYIRAKIKTEEKNNKIAIIVTELPYQVNKARLIEKIAELVRDKKITGISELRDESDKDGMRIVIELKRNENPDVMINNLYSQTQLQSSFGINIVALVNNQPKTLTLVEIIDSFIQHRREVVTRRCIFDLKKAKEKAHILEGLGIALGNIDKMISIIKVSPNPSIAKEKILSEKWEPSIVRELVNLSHECKLHQENLTGLIDNVYVLSKPQAQAILDLRLHKLTALEQEKIISEYKNYLKIIQELISILENPEKLMNLIRQELIKIKDEFNDARKTNIIETEADLSVEDLITEESVVITVSHLGYIKYQPLSSYQSQKRGGKGKIAAKTKEEDYVDKIIVANTLNSLLCFSSFGKVYWLKTYQLPLAARTSKGKPIVNLLPIDDGEKITTILPVDKFSDDQFVFMATNLGHVKKVPLSNFSKPRNGGIRSISMIDNEELIGVALTNGEKNIMLFSNTGKVNRFSESEVREMGRTARGVRGIKLKDDQKVIDLVVVNDGESILTITEHGYGKRTLIDEYRQTSRSGQGVISIQVSERNGKVVRATEISSLDEAILITNSGTLVRLRANDISQVGRNTQGVRLIKLNEGNKLVGVQRVDKDLIIEEDEEE